MTVQSSFARVIGLLTDHITATVASLWPRSTAALEARRLVVDGHAGGQACDLYFLVSFEGALPDGALATIRAAQFAVREQDGAASGFVTVRTQVRLAAYDLSLAAARLDRIAAGFDGFATLIGAARPANEDTRPVRVPGRSVAAT